MLRSISRSPPRHRPITAMEPPRPQPPRPQFSFLSRIATPSKPKHAYSRLWISIAALTALACAFLGLRSHSGRRFGIVIDGGSTGTRMHVFAYVDGSGGVPIVDVGASKTLKVVPGLSSYAGEPDGAGKSIQELIEFARRVVPMEQWGETEVRLKGTAGLRLLEVGVQERILEACRKVLRGSGFSFRDDWAEVITGSEEGIYAWVTANYALGTLGNDHQQTTGVIELGGASAQITFVSSEPLPPELSHVLKFGNITYNLYTHSFLHFGQNVAYESIHMLLQSGDLKSSADPCSPKGYTRGYHSEISANALDDLQSNGNFSECRIVSQMLLHKGKDKCSYKHCSIGSVYVPELKGNFLATENFFYTSKFFGIGPTARLSDVVNAGEQYCSTDWMKLKETYHTFREEELLQYCFSSAYIVALLHDSLGIALDEKRIGFANRVRDIPLDWAMGSFLMQRMSADARPQLVQSSPDWMTNIANNDSLTLLVILGILSVLFIAAWSASKWNKPQLKTMCDLERGRHIISRISP